MHSKTIDITSSTDTSTIHYHQWIPEKPKAWLHIMHGMAEHSARYNDLANFLNQNDILVTANDHRGHGLTGSAHSSLYHFGDHNSWNQMVDDQWHLIRSLSQQHQLPLIILGHSMGSFMATRFCQLYPSVLQRQYNQKLAGLILSGSNYMPSAVCKIIAGVAWLERARLGGRNISNLLEQLSVGSFNRAFNPVRTDKDWLCKDHTVVDNYIADPWCGGAITTQSWYDFINGLADLARPQAMKKIDSELPVYLFSGQQDPVGGNGRGVLKLQRALLDAAIKQVDIKLYSQGRHEMLNETNSAEVHEDLVNWLRKTISL
ncbi:MAG: alpha/beta fold hydrolase [Porticoccaceae bacterium]